MTSETPHNDEQSPEEERFPGAMLGVSILALAMALAFFGAAWLYIGRL